MNWFERHLNWTYFFSIVLALFLFGIPSGALYGLQILAAIAIFVGSTGWVLYQKRRSYGWLLLSFSGIGIFIILCLQNKRPEADAQRAINEYLDSEKEKRKTVK